VTGDWQRSIKSAVFERQVIVATAIRAHERE
jgi:hypothetical protein